MAEDVNQHLSSFFDVVDRATGPLAGITRAFEGAQIGIQRTTALINPLNAALATVGAGFSFDKMLDIQSAYENSVIKMAQTAKMMGRGGESFADAMKSARDMIGQVNTAAAALPGEAEDYTLALQMGGTTVQRAVGDYQKTFDLIKDITAITISNQRSAAEGAMQLNKMLNAEKGMLEQQNDYSMQLIQNMREIPGYSNLTVQAFNNMKLEERVKIVGLMRDQFKGMIDESSNTLDAIKGATMTIFKTLTQKATLPLFDGIKEGLKFINDQFMDSEGHLTRMGEQLVHIGEVISGTIVDGVRDIAAGRVNFAELGAGAGAAASLAGGAALPLVALGAGLGEFLTRTEDVNNVLGQLADIANLLLSPLSMMRDGIDVVGVLVADVLSGTLGSLLYAIQQVLDPLLMMGGILFDVAMQVALQLRPVLQGLWGAVGTLLEGIGEFLNPIIKILGFALYGLYSLFKEYVLPVFSDLITGVSFFIEMLGQALKEIAGWLNLAIDEAAGAGVAGAGGVEKGVFDGFLAAFKIPEVKDTITGGGAAAQQQQQRGAGGRMVQDFRFSRFEISQKFEEGFDPDRIAVAFANDLGRVGEQKLQSGFAPLFSVGV